MNDKLKAQGLFSGQDAVSVARGKRESPGPHFVRVAKVWSALLGHNISAEQVVQCMVGLKLAREAGQHDPDNMIDAEGYASLMPEVRKWSQNAAGPMVFEEAGCPSDGRDQPANTVSREWAINVARMHAAKGGMTEKHGYLPSSVAEAMEWTPHDWVIDAVMASANR